MSCTRETVKSEILNFIRQLPGDDVNKEDLSDEGLEFVEGIGMDSLHHLELVMHIEREFKVKVPDDLLEKAKTIKALTDIVWNMMVSSEL